MKKLGAYLLATAVVAMCTAVDWVVQASVSESDLLMVYLVGVLVVARLLALGPALWSTALSVAAFDILFVAPRFTLAVDETRYFISFAVTAATAVVFASTTARIRTEAQRARERAQRLELLYEFSRDLATAEEDTDLVDLARTRLRCSLGLEATMLSPAGAADKDTHAVDFRLEDASECFGVLRVRPSPGTVLTGPTCETLEALAHQLSVSQARARSTTERRRVRVEVERERLRNALLSSVSHDLRTPLGSIIGAASTLVGTPELEISDRAALTKAIHEEATLLARWLDNLLEMTRIEGGAMRVDKQFEVPEEIVGAVLARVAHRAREHDVEVDIAEEPSLVSFDPLLMEVVMTNLVENALSYSPPGSSIVIRGRRVGDRYQFVVEDSGPGVPPEERERIFEKFYRCDSRTRSGAGLGLAICRAIVEAQGGDIRATGHGTEPGLAVVVDLPYESHQDEGDRHEP